MGVSKTYFIDGTTRYLLQDNSGVMELNTESGGAELDDLITAVGTDKAHIIISRGVDLTKNVPENISCEFIEDGAINNPVTNKDVDWYGPIIAAPFQNIFGGTSNIDLRIYTGATDKVSVGWFGAYPDTLIDGNEVDGTVGQDNHTEIEDCIRASRDIRVVWLPPRTNASGKPYAYRVTSQINIEHPTPKAFKAYKFFGGDGVNGASAIYGDMTSGAIVNMQDSRNGVIRNLYVLGKNMSAFYYNQKAGIQLLTGTISVSASSTTVIGSGTDFTGETGELKVGHIISAEDSDGVMQHLTITAIASDTSLTVSTGPAVAISSGSAAFRYRKFIENYVDDGIDTTQKTALTGVATDAKNDDLTYGSKQVTIKNVTVHNCYIGFAGSLHGNPQGDTLGIIDCQAKYNAIAVVSGDTQNRGCVVRDIEVNYTHTLFNNVDHGGGASSFYAFEGGKTQVVNTYQLLNATTSVGGTCVIEQLYGEFIGRIGECLGGNNGRTLRISGCDIEFQPDTYKSDVEFIKFQTQIHIVDCSLDMDDYPLFYFQNSKNTVLDNVVFRSDSGLPQVVTNYDSAEKLIVRDCSRYDGASTRVGFDNTLYVDKVDNDTVQDIEWFHRQAMIGGSEVVANLVTFKRQRTLVFRAPKSSNSSWSGDTVTYDVSYGESVFRVGQLTIGYKWKAPGESITNADIVMMGEITSVDYSTKEITAKMLWHEYSEANPGNIYVFTRHYFPTQEITGSITNGTSSLTVESGKGSLFEVNDYVYLLGAGGSARVTAISGDVLTLHKNATATLTNANIGDVVH